MEKTKQQKAKDFIDQQWRYHCNVYSGYLHRIDI